MNLAIQGHSNRGNEVISYLERLGGKNPYSCNGLGTLCAYYIFEGNIRVVTIEELFKSNEYILYSLEGILEKFPYKVGDKVKDARINDFIGRITNVQWDYNEEQIIYTVEWDDATKSTLNYFARGLQPYKEETIENNINYCQLGKITTVCFQDTNYEDKVELQLGNDYEIKEENGKYYAVKQFKYPKTYEKCCEVLGCKANDFYTEFSCDGNDVEISDYEDKIDDLLQNFRKLRYYRDAYWKIAGEQMGLGKPWEYDMSKDKFSYAISYQYGYIQNTEIRYKNIILVFPTKEMCDTFYENFKELIETCKELL